MKKLLTLSLIAGTLAFSACGPSKEEKEAAEKAKQDSIAMVAAAEKATQDSLAMIQKATEDSINNAAKMKAMQDSMDMMKDKMSKPAPKAKSSSSKTETKTKSLKEMVEEAKKKQH
jgi:hypothetical protein